jgi:NAD(P)-dependent dehydrogenase (short-subunit alcohol dehydrogenase family)
MTSDSEHGVVIVTGGDGHIGREVCRLLKASGTKFLSVDGIRPVQAMFYFVTSGRRTTCSGTRLAVSGEPEGYTGLGEILPSAAYMARLAVAVA